MFFRKGKYSDFIYPISLIFDLVVINVLAYNLPLLFKFPLLFHSYISLAWIIIAIKIKFYEIYRFAKATYILKQLFRQFVFFFLILYAFIGFFKQPNISRFMLGIFFLSICISVLFLKFLNYYLLKEYRAKVKGNISYVVVIGNNKKTDQLIKIFKNYTEYGYQLLNQFDPKALDFDINKCIEFISENKIDEIYCSVRDLNNNEISELVNYADNNLIGLKFIPDNKEIFTKKLNLEYYEYLPILSLRELPLDDPFNRFYKRLFDISCFIFIICICTLLVNAINRNINRTGFKRPCFFQTKQTRI